MYLDKNWRVLTIGDGDLSFSLSLFKDQGIEHLSASVLDEKDTLNCKYAINAITSLQRYSIPLFFGLDVTNPDSFSTKLRQQFDLIIFQFPLIPQYRNLQAYEHNRHLGNNVLNRQLLCQFLDQSFNYFCDPSGAGLAYITSKNVKPYSHWNIENLYDKQNAHYLGEMPFNIEDFPRYQLRNVDRDKVVKSTQSTTYVWGTNPPAELQSQLKQSIKHLPDHCNLCGKGPFDSESQRAAHQQSAMHLKLSNYEMAWQEAKAKGLVN
ncbi:class I SAM-dependent methyltransferase [Aliiglaciecola litoralis]|uniref:25S rRNA (uridine-N(3))-methyltransferase BMT5-like domain-containing protein n=1 Tax=Aliiglaciecola litoralis TaxID=582857 RepID=A0ABP3WQS3_9ALTE